VIGYLVLEPADVMQMKNDGLQMKNDVMQMKEERREVRAK
jgi:hypothetical protein